MFLGQEETVAARHLVARGGKEEKHINFIKNTALLSK